MGSILIVDIETYVKGDGGRPDPKKDSMRFFFAYDYIDDKHYCYHFKQVEAIKSLLKKHRVIVGFNFNYYDLPILQREGYWSSGHLVIDLMEVMEKRGEYLGGQRGDTYSLDSSAKLLKLDFQKMDFDYSILMKDDFTEGETAMIRVYGENDINITKELNNKLIDYFKPFTEFLSPGSVNNFSWLTSSISVYAYKVICYLTGLKEEYGDRIHKDFGGGFVAEPSVAEAHEEGGRIYALDFSSLYPHIFFQANLFSWNCNCCKEDDKWKGNEMFPIIGAYCKKKHGRVEEVLHDLYKKRMQWKKEKDRREYVLKIVMNSLYGITANSAFKSLYHYESASDCTLIGRESIKFARVMFDKAGYKVLYSDTDSVYLQDPYNDKDRLMMIKNNIIRSIQEKLTFPASTFDMAIDAEIAHIWFFKTGNVYKKKNYIYVTTDGKLKVVGLPIIKSDSSKVAMHIFKKYISEEVKKGKLKQDYNIIRDLVFKELEENLEIAGRTFKVWNTDIYKKEHQLQAKISERYGPGKHILLPNRLLGVGNSIKYCTIDEFRSKGYTPGALILNKMWNELEPFLSYKPKEVKIHGKSTPQTELFAWTNIGD